MRNPSSKSSISSGSTSNKIKPKISEHKICKARTKKGARCTNKVISGSEYCGILSHKELNQTVSLMNLSTEL